MAEIAQALDGGGHRWGRLAGGGHEQGDGAAVAGDGDLLAGAHGIKQSHQVGFGLEGADTAHEVKTSLCGVSSGTMDLRLSPPDRSLPQGHRPRAPDPPGSPPSAPGRFAGLL